MPLKDFIHKIQERIANTSVSSSTVRGQPRGTVEKAQDYLKTINLKDFSKIKDERQFNRSLNKHTASLKKRIDSKSWGISRKVLNIFLFEASNNVLLNKKYSLHKIIPFLELTLDNPNAKELIKLAKIKNKKLIWKTISSLKSGPNKQFQKFAKDHAYNEYCKMFRCYLDVYWWRSEKKFTKKMEREQ